jgi:hypothetical protein
MLTGRKEKTALAAQIAAVGHIVYGTPNIKSRYSFITIIPFFIQK